jgi:hypothetical protein
MMDDGLPMMERLRIAEEEAEALTGLGARVGHQDADALLRVATGELLAKEKQVERLMSELDEALRRERGNAGRSAKAVALCEAKASASRRHLTELKA